MNEDQLLKAATSAVYESISREVKEITPEDWLVWLETHDGKIRPHACTDNMEFLSEKFNELARAINARNS